MFKLKKNLFADKKLCDMNYNPATGKLKIPLSMTIKYNFFLFQCIPVAEEQHFTLGV